MPFVKFSPEYLADGFTLVDNLFINEYMPNAPEDAVRVYLYGLYLCSQAINGSNKIDLFTEALNMTEDQIESAFKYWEEKGLIEFVNRNPVELRYLPLKLNIKSIRKYKSEKYLDFNRQLQELFPDRMLTPNEYSEYYYIIETTRMTPEAMLMVAKYCIDYKGDNVRYPYILAVARNWANEGILSVEAVENRLLELEADSTDMQELYYTLGKKGTPSLSDLQEYTKWLKSWGFNKESILYAASTLKGKGNISRLDKLLDEYFRMDIYDLKDMQEYMSRKEELFDIAIAVNKSLGIYYESLDIIVETYINPWISKGYDKETLLLIGDYCFKGSIRKLEGMNDVINRFYKLGLISSESIINYLNNLLKNDSRIKLILEKAEINKSITASDRNYYKTWSEEWGLSDELILYAAELATGRARAFTFINKTLSNWKSEGIDSVAKAMKSKPYQEPANENKAYVGREYTKDQLNALFDDIDDIGV